MRAERTQVVAAAAASALVLLIVLASTLEANSFFDKVKRPFKSTYQRARNLKNRVMHRPGKQLSEQVSGAQSLQAVVRTLPANYSVQPRSAVGDDGEGEIDHTARASRGDASDTSEGDFGAMCVFSRGPSMKRPPTLFYFSPQVNNRGCEVQVELELASENNEHRQLNASFARESIQSKLLDSHLYNPSRPTYFLTHGFMAAWNSGNWMCDTKDLILDNIEANIFIVDWSGGSKPMLPIDYGAAVSNTQYVASLIGEFILTLMEMSGQTDARHFRLIGHSLGAHISGFIGYHVGSVGQITGLDPAGPCFSTRSAEEGAQAAESGLLRDGTRRLSPASAEYVLALHTDTALFGLNENCGHYDVYVNGGLKQPGCSESSVAGRFQELIAGNLQDTFDLNIACAHSYAHSLLNKFLPYGSLSEIRSRLFGLLRSRRAAGQPAEKKKLDKCYPIAYECATWDAYKSGECGFCRDHDRRCVYAGLGLENFAAQKETFDNEYTTLEVDKFESGSGLADLELNGEVDLGDETKDDKEQPNFETTRRNARGQHFLRTTEKEMSCLFQYQLVVAAHRSQVDERVGSDADQLYYYLQVPLEHAGVLNVAEGEADAEAQEQPYVRLVQVSHRLDPESPAYANIKSIYLEALKERTNGAAGVDLDATRDDLDLYTALITFRQRPEDQCPADDATNGQHDSKDKWQLCEPLDRLKEARLWSPNRDKLEAVAWVALNYMSGVSYDQRMTKSYLMPRAGGEAAGALERDTLDERTRAKLDDLDPDKSKSFANKLDEARDKADCLVHSLHKNSSRKVKCRKDSEELAFALELAPKKL